MINNSLKKLDTYLAALADCAPTAAEATFRKVADSYEDDLLEFEDFPVDYFNFFMKLLSERKYYSKPGLWNFLLVLGTESHKLLPLHYKMLGEKFVENYDKYRDEDLCLAICDFIARNYPPDKAKNIFGRLFEIENKKDESLRGFVADGLRILAAEEMRMKGRN
jgi:hypothetical protein